MEYKAALKSMNDNHKMYNEQWVQDRTDGERYFIFKLYVIDKFVENDFDVFCDFGNDKYAYLKDVIRGSDIIS